jgi:hypothetical protein
VPRRRGSTTAAAWNQLLEQLVDANPPARDGRLGPRDLTAAIGRREGTGAVYAHHLGGELVYVPHHVRAGFEVLLGVSRPLAMEADSNDLPAVTAVLHQQACSDKQDVPPSALELAYFRILGNTREFQVLGWLVAARLEWCFGLGFSRF